MMKNYDVLATFEGTLETVDEINEAIANLTGDDEPCFDPESDDWREWVIWKGGKTLIICTERR
jgi:hypothetical protein